jgi:hypothetical protein
MNLLAQTVSLFFDGHLMRIVAPLEVTSDEPTLRDILADGG